MKRAEASRGAAVDHVMLEVLRSRLDAIIGEASAAIERTAISPIVTAGDYAVTLLDATGGLVAAGRGSNIAGASAHSVKWTIARYGDEIGPGDVFLANDPHNGGGLHAQDVTVQRPIYAGERRVAWVVNSAHMMDVGGMIPGSFASAATDCFAEALRLPAVRLFRAGVEVTDVWDIFRNNVRIADLVTTDLRSLVAGCHVAQEKVVGVVESMGVDAFVQAIAAIQELSDKEMRRRIEQIADGVYRATSWAEWDHEFFKIPCTLTVDGDRLIFDFDGAAPQAPHYFNSKPYIIESMFASEFAWLVAADLPYTEAIFARLEFRCPEGSIVNSVPPAPVGASHMDVALAASEMALQCVRLALGASPDADAARFIAGWGGYSALGVQAWSAVGIDGNPDTWVMQDGQFVGASAGRGRDGRDLGMVPVAREMAHMGSDIEVLEAWYPILITEKRPRPRVGAGKWRSGAGVQMSFRPHGTPRLTGEMLGMRRWLPLQGAAGGAVGSTTQFLMHRRDGTIEELATHGTGVVIADGEAFEFRVASGGGFGDPLDRDPEVVGAEVEFGTTTAEEAAQTYGVVVDRAGLDAAATSVRRETMRRDRLVRANAPERALSESDIASFSMSRAGESVENPLLPLYPGVVHRGPVAYAEESGTPLALAPDHWTTGCAVLEERFAGPGPDVTIRWYLDPRTGRSLYVDVVAGSEPRSFEVLPRRWIEAAGT